MLSRGCLDARWPKSKSRRTRNGAFRGYRNVLRRAGGCRRHQVVRTRNINVMAYNRNETTIAAGKCDARGRGEVRSAR